MHCPSPAWFCQVLANVVWFKRGWANFHAGVGRLIAMSSSSLGSMISVSWKTCKRGKVSWTEAEALRVGEIFYNELPPTAREMILNGTFNGDELVTLQQPLALPSRRELEENFVFVVAMCRSFPDRIGSAYLVADALIYINKRYFSGKLLRSSEDLNTVAVAVREGYKLKRCLQAARNLWRRSEGAKSAKLGFIKSLLVSRHSLAYALAHLTKNKDIEAVTMTRKHTDHEQTFTIDC
jgi:hypothetical protein